MSSKHTLQVDVTQPASYRYGEKLPADSAMLEELLRTTDIQQLFESFYSLVNIPVAIIDLNANVLFSSRWQRICSQFHRVHPTTCGLCVESDTQLATQLQEGKDYAIYACRNGLTDSAAPIVLEGRHVANVFVGQFLTKEPDESWFRQKAEEFGFDVADYLAALHEVPIVDAAKVPVIIGLLMRMTRVITNLAIERKHAIDSQARQNIILNAIPQSVFWKDIQGKYLGCNAPFAKAAGLATPDDIVGKTDFDLPWPREEAEAYRADDQAVLSANQPKLHIIEPLQQADGSHLVIDTSKIPLVDSANTPYGVLGIYEDITERKRAEDELRLSEQKFGTIFHSSPVPLARSEYATGLFLEVNEALLRLMHAASVTQMVGRTSIEIGMVSGEERQKIIAAVDATPWVDRLQINMHRLDGDPFVAELSLTSYESEGKRYLLTNIVDVSERKRADDKLRKSEAYRRAIFESARDAILIMRDERFIDCNPSALSLFGADRVSLIEHTPVDFSPELQPDGRRSRDSVLERIGVALNGTPQFFDWKHQRLDGTVFDAEVSLNRVEFDQEVFIQAIVRDVSERKRADEALRKSEERFQLSMEATSDGLWDWNAETDEVYYSPSCYHMLGYEVGAFPGTLKGWQNLLHPDDMAHTMQINMDCVEGRRETFSVEYRLKASSGEWRWILGRGKSIARDPLGRSLRLIGTNVDITERKKTESHIQKLTRLYATLSQVNTTIVHSANREDLFLNICKGAVEQGGFLLAWVGLVDDATRMITPVCHYGAEQGYLSNIVISTDDIPSGRGPTGTAIRENLVCYVNDYASDQRAIPWREAALMRSFRGAAGVPLRFNGKPIGALTIYTHEVDFFDADQLKLLEEMAVDLNFALDNISHEAERKLNEEQLAQEYRHIAEMNAQLSETNTQLKKAQDQLIQSEKMAAIGQLAAGVVHEINTPTAFVTSNVGSLEGYLGRIFALLEKYETVEKLLDGDAPLVKDLIQLKQKVDIGFLRKDTASLIAETNQGLERVKKIIQDLKNFSRADSSEQWVRADLHKGLDATLNVAWNELKYKCEVIKEYGVLPEIDCHPNQLDQVFLNLLVNAAHAIEERGKIIIRTGQEGDRVWVEVSDTGKGIPRENIPHLFEPFFTTKPAGIGTGLGLSVSFSIVERHHGRIEVQSEVGKGSTFRVWLPVQQRGNR